MGGCRCTYRNCTVKSDGKTHMFHYPVFDKLRCHQWIVNARRLDLLELKVSQLKNRVICQNHFTDDNFMNFKRDKLTISAVPTQDGPYCTHSEENDSIEASHIYPITIDDIENELLTCKEKKANFSVKYVDFLTNTDVEPVAIDTKLENAYSLFTNNNINLDELDTLAINNSSENYQVFNHTNKVSLPPESSKKYQNQPMQVVSPFYDCKSQPIVAGTSSKMWVKDCPVTVECPNTKTVVDTPNKTMNLVPKKSSRVKILSQKKIYDPVPLVGKMEPVTPDLVLRLHNNEIVLHNPKTVDRNSSHQLYSENELVFENTFQNSQSERSLLKPQILNNIDQQGQAVEIEISNTPVEVLPSTSIKSVNQCNRSTSRLSPSVKPRISLERVAEIAEKRNFNKKLRDVVQFCLDDAEEHKTAENSKIKIAERVPKQLKDTKIIEEVEEVKNDTDKEIFTKPVMKTAESVKQPITKQSHSEKRKVSQETDSDLSNHNSYNMTLIEARLKRMEDLLLNKIDQNSKKISDIKKTILTKTSKTVSTQIPENHESYKKLLYEQISQFLSPNTNSLIYEELFINKYSKSQKTSLSQLSESPSPVKRRRCR